MCKYSAKLKHNLSQHIKTLHFRDSRIADRYHISKYSDKTEIKMNWRDFNDGSEAVMVDAESLNFI